jgi:hypothetical protein
VEADQLPSVSRGGAADGEAHEIDREEPASSDHVRGAESQRGRRERRDRYERSDGPRDPGEDPHRRCAEDDADRQPERELADDQQHEIAEAVGLGVVDPGDQTQRERDGHRVVAAGLGLERPGKPSPDMREAERREHGGGVGRGHHGAEQDRLEPREVEERIRGHAGQNGSDDDSDRAEQRGRHRHAPQAPPRRLQSSLVEDEHEADDADLTRQRRVVELDAARAVGPEQHPQREKRHEDGEPRPGRSEREHDARRQHQADDQERKSFVHPRLLPARSRP